MNGDYKIECSLPEVHPPGLRKLELSLSGNQLKVELRSYIREEKTLGRTHPDAESEAYLTQINDVLGLFSTSTSPQTTRTPSRDKAVVTQRYTLKVDDAWNQQVAEATREIEDGDQSPGRHASAGVLLGAILLTALHHKGVLPKKECRDILEMLEPYGLSLSEIDIGVWGREVSKILQGGSGYVGGAGPHHPQALGR